LSDRSKQAESKDLQVQAALREYLDGVDRGEPVDREKFLARHAPIAEQLRSFIAAEEDVRKLAAARAETPREPADDSTRSFAERGQETVVPRSTAKKNVAHGLEGRFGRYRIIRALGKGAMGAVYLAEDTQIERQVALKTPHFTEDPTGEQMERFFREARAAGNLRHPHICPIYDFGQIDGRHFITMAYIEGRPLSDFIQPDNQQPERQILVLVRKLALALQEAHDQGVVHRDLKPANIMVDKKGEPIIMDFGLAQQTRPNEDVRLTQTGNIVGTPAFMSPEQVEGGPDKIGPPTDQYSLDVILYELLTGDLPFRGSIMAVMAQILAKDPAPPSQRRPDLDARVEAVCLKMMAKNSAERFRSLKVAADEISSILKSPGAKVASKEKPASAPAPADDRTRASVGASQVLKSLKQKALSEQDLESLEELARKCYSRRDFEQVAQIIERVPEKHRNAALKSLLEKSRNKADEISFLLCDIDEAVRLNDRAKALKKADDLLKIKPGHHRAREIQEKFAGYGAGGAARIGLREQFTKLWNEGGWIPWSALAFGLACFGIVTGVIFMYLRGTAITIDVRAPDVDVAVKGSKITIIGPRRQTIQVEPGEQELTIRHRDLELVSKTFSLKSGQKKTVTIAIVDSNIVAESNGETLPLTSHRVGSEDKKSPATIPKNNQLAGPKAQPVQPADSNRPALLKSPFDAATAKSGQERWSEFLGVPVGQTDVAGLTLVLIPPGEYLMGAPDSEKPEFDEKPQHKVRITRPFYISAYELTRGQFATFVKETGYQTQAEKGMPLGGAGIDAQGRVALDPKCNWRNPGFAQNDRHPVVVVSWHDANAFCDWLSKKTAQVYRLPTEAEWEYACRAGTTTTWYSGDNEQDLVKIANLWDASWIKHFPKLPGANEHQADDGYVFTAPVGSFRPNAFGLFDMHGNVFEFVQDWSTTAYYATSPVDDPPGAAAGTSHVSRGGAMDNVRYSRSAARDGNGPSDRFFNLGFRIVRNVPEQELKTPRSGPIRQSANGPGDLSLLVAPFDETTAKSARTNWAAHLLTPVELTNSIGMKFGLIPPGEYQMGSSDNRADPNTRPVHKARITSPFYLGLYEVTQEEYQRVMGANPSVARDDPRCPVDSVDPSDINEFCRRLSELPAEKAARRLYRLPSEAEWEYACRAGTETLFAFGDTITARQANFDTRDSLFGPKQAGLGRAVKVGSYPPNAFGLFDMHGNVMELCEDYYDREFYAHSTVDDPLNARPHNPMNSTMRGG
jgi:formylglycine-generating enzyme required for sulfatase activity/serine/threonine protein kinase